MIEHTWRDLLVAPEACDPPIEHVVCTFCRVRATRQDWTHDDSIGYVHYAYWDTGEPVDPECPGPLMRRVPDENAVPRQGDVRDYKPREEM